MPRAGAIGEASIQGEPDMTDQIQQDEHDGDDRNVIELGTVSDLTKGGMEHMIEDRDPLV